MTIAARSCPTYEDITANRARNNIMESLKDLGPDTPYGQNGLPLLVDPAVEAQVQPNCTAIDNWEFTLGKGIATRDAVPPEPWGRLSYVTDPFSPAIITQTSVPLLQRPRPADRLDHLRRDDDHADRRAAQARRPGQQAVDPGWDQGEPDHRRR